MSNLQAILTRKFNNPVIHDVMKKISETVVNGDSNRVRVNSRHVRRRKYCFLSTV